MALVFEFLWIMFFFWLIGRLLYVVTLLIRNVSGRKKQKVAVSSPVQAQIPKKEMPNPVEMVRDALTEKYIAKDKAYQLARDDKIYYFASWENRQRFLEEN
jgi:hypothetical protein